MDLVLPKIRVIINEQIHMDLVLLKIRVIINEQKSMDSLHLRNPKANTQKITVIKKNTENINE